MSSNQKLNIEELKTLVFDQGLVTKQNKDKLFKLAKAAKDIECIEKLRDDFNFKSAKRYLEKLNTISLEKVLKTRDIHMFKVLLKQKINISTINIINLIKSNYSLEFIRTSIDAGANINITDQDGNTPLIYASFKGKKEIVELLTQNGADVSMQNRLGYTALMRATIEGHRDVVEIFCNNHTKKNNLAMELKDNKGMTALMHALENNQIETAKLLTMIGGNMDNSLRKDLMYASYFGHIEIVEDLVSRINRLKELDAPKVVLEVNNINWKDSSDWTALIWASYAGNKDIVEYLFKNGANINSIDINNQSALKHAIKNGHDRTVEYLIEKEATLDIYDVLLSLNTLKFGTIKKIIESFDEFHNYAHVALIIANDRRTKDYIYNLTDKKNTEEEKKKIEKELTKINNDVNGNYNYINGIEHDKLTIKMQIEEGKQYQLEKKQQKKNKRFSELQNKYGGPIGLIKSNEVKILEEAVDNGVYTKELLININTKGKNTLLKEAVKQNNFLMTSLLLKYDIVDLDNTALKIAEEELYKDIIDLFLKKHNPQKVTRLLTNFRKDTPIKYTTHIWDMNFKDDYGDFKTYLLRVADQWNEIEEQLKELSPRLHSKIYTFLLNTNIDTQGWCSKNGDDINMGWSSVKGLEEWCNAGNDPFNFLLEKPYKVENKTITTFGNVITLFKQEIQIRNENNMLLNIFTDIEEQLDEEFDGIFEFELINLKGKTFYIDTEIFKNILVDRIFKDMVKPERHKFKNIKIEIGQNTSLNYHELRIIQIGSQSNQSSHDMLNHHGADTSIIKEELANLCDWSIESSSATENYRINYLKSDATLDDIEPLDYTPEGYTHIMRFYK